MLDQGQADWAFILGLLLFIPGVRGVIGCNNIHDALIDGILQTDLIGLPFSGRNE